jgi:type IV secretory pathway VirB10-like protein
VKLLVAAILITGLVTVACGKKRSTAPEAAAPSTAVENVAAPDSSAEPAANEPAPIRRRATPATPVPKAAPAQASSVDEALVGAVHTFMTAQLKKFIEEKGRIPKDFSEFASSRMDSVPRPPAGMKFVIDETTQEVKVVRK